MAVLFPTAYFGSIAYFQELLRHPAAAIEVWDTFPKQTFRNRCVILGPQGEMRLTLPVEKPNGSKSRTNEIRIIDQPEWRNQHWRAIRSSYAAAPFFEHYASDIEALIFTREPDLVTYNRLITSKIISLFDASVELSTTSDFIPPTGEPDDFRTVAFDDPDPKDFVNQKYTQVLFTKHTFYPNPSILDLLFCEGPMGRKKLIFLKK